MPPSFVCSRPCAVNHQWCRDRVATVIDPKIPFLAAALDLPQAQGQLHRAIPQLCRVTAATLVRHKPGRRALVKYQVETATGPLTLLGKIRAKGTDRTSYQIQQALWQTGWDADSRDRMSIPEPLGLVPDWHMTLQRQVSGIPLTQLLATDQGIPLAERIAALAHKLHRTPVPTTKTHTLGDELSILRDRLPLVAEQYPQWAARIEDILTACDHLAAPFFDPGARAAGPTASDPLPSTGIHRDFYADQVLVDGDRLWLVDLDLCCQGSPALDIGNFIAHITEQSLREKGDAESWGDRAAALQAAYVGIYCGAHPREQVAAALAREIDLYAALTLVRHIHISNQIVSRRPYTEALLGLCEARLGYSPPNADFDRNAAIWVGS